MCASFMSDDGCESFVLRDLITPFAHPLLTFWTGLALGIAVYRRRPLAWALWGYAIAVATHALLNGPWELAGVRLSPVGIALYLALLIPVASSGASDPDSSRCRARASGGQLAR